MFNLYFTALKSLAVKETNRYLRIWVQTLVPRVYNILCKFQNSRIKKISLEERTNEYAL